MPKAKKLIGSQKCQRCRHDKQKVTLQTLSNVDRKKTLTLIECVPEGRQWPGDRCGRCIKYDYVCSANRTRSEEQSVGNRADPLVTQAPASTPISEPSIAQLLQEMGDLRVVRKTGLNGVHPYPIEGLHEDLDTVVYMLQERARQLTLEGKYRDAERIYTHILAPPTLLELTELEEYTPSDCLTNLVLIYESTGNLSGAEAAQESLLRWAIESGDYSEGEVILEAKKLCDFYVLFYKRIRSITVRHGNDQDFSAEFSRILMFFRVAALDISSFNHLIELIEIPDNALHITVAAGATLLTAGILEYSSCDVNTKDGDGDTALHVAVRKCETEMVQSLLNKDVDLEIVNEEGDTALLLALKQTSKQAFGLIKSLLVRGSNPNVTDRIGRTTLHLAAESGTPDVTQIILSCGVEFDALDFSGSTPLMIAAARSDSSNCVPIAQQLLESGANVNAVGDEDGTPLIRASRFGNIEMVQLLIARGADVESRDVFSRTALHRVLDRTAGTKEKFIATLIKAQIDIEAEDYDGRSALGVALKRDTLAVAQQLLEHGADVEAELDGEKLLSYVVRLGNVPATKLLLERGANVHARNDTGETPLIVAVCAGRRSIVDILLGYGADIEARNNKGETPLYIAVCQSEDSILQALIHHGANVEAGNLIGTKPLYVAVASTNGAIFRILLNRGVNVSTMSQVGDDQIDPLLHRAIRNADLATVEMLLDAAPHAILAVDLKGNTPFHQAILEGREPHNRILELLLDRSHLTERFANEDGNTPLHLAVIFKKYQMAKMLLAAQSSPNAFKILSMRNSKGKQVPDLVWDPVVHETISDVPSYWELRLNIRDILTSEHTSTLDFSSTMNFSSTLDFS